MAQTGATRKFNLETATREELVDRINKLEKALARTREQLGIASDIVADFYWLDKLMKNPTFSGNEKAVLYGARKVTARREPREDGYSKIYREDVAEESGVSPETAGSTLKKLAEHDIIGRKLEPVRDKDTGKVTKALFIQLPQKILQEPEMKKELKEDENGWGGERVKLSVCCKAPVVPLERYSCTCCGQTLTADEVLEVSEQALANDAALQRELEYPEVPRQELAARDVHAPQRACLVCGHNEWLPALVGDDWIYQCGYCYPFLASSQGRDLRKREGIA